MLTSEMNKLARMSPSVMVMADPRMGRKAKKPIPVEALLADVQVASYPLKFAHSADAVVQQGAQHIAYRAIDHQHSGIQAGGQQPQHDGFTAEWEKAAGEKGRQQHAPVAIVYEKIGDGIHRL